MLHSQDISSDSVIFSGQVSQETDPLVYISVPRNQARSIIQHGMADTMVKLLAIHIIDN